MMILAIGGLFFMGLVFAVSGMLHGIATLWYLLDPLFCFLMGGILLALWLAAGCRRQS